MPFLRRRLRVRPCNGDGPLGARASCPRSRRQARMAYLRTNAPYGACEGKMPSPPGARRWPWPLADPRRAVFLRSKLLTHWGARRRFRPASVNRGRSRYNIPASDQSFSRGVGPTPRVIRCRRAGRAPYRTVSTLCCTVPQVWWAGPVSVAYRHCVMRRRDATSDASASRRASWHRPQRCVRAWAF